MNNQKVTVSIGISALNEELNIKTLLKSILKQNCNNFILDEIYVVSDGSTDNTVLEVKSIQDDRIRIIENKNRNGKISAENKLFDLMQSDIAVILDADIKLKSEDTLYNLVNPLINDKNLHMTSGSLTAYPPTNFTEKVLYSGFILFQRLADTIEKNDAYHCVGAIRAFKKELYKQMKFPKITSEDVFPYFYCMKNGFKFKYIKDAEIIIKLPNSWKDHIKQQKRYINNHLALINNFGEDFVSVYFTMTEKQKLIYMIKNFYKLNLYYYCYFLIGLFARFKNVIQEKPINDNRLWDVSESTKMNMHTKKKIIISNYDDLNNPYYGGGGAISIHEVAKRLSEDFEITVITGKYPNSKNEIKDNVNYTRIGFKKGGPFLGQLFFQFLLPFCTFIYKSDVWIESYTPPFSTAFLPLFTRRPVIGLTQMLGGEEMAKKYRLPFDKIESIGIKTYKYLIALNESIRDKVKSINNKIDIKIIPNGISEELINIEVKKESKYILYLGRIDFVQKGLDLLLDSYKRIENDISYKLIIAGSGTKGDLNLLSDKIKSLNLSDKVEFVGHVSGNNKNKLLSDAAFVVIPSRFETFGIIVLEALCFLNPIIIFDIEGFRWVPDEYSIKVPKYDIEAFAKGMSDLSNNSFLRNSKSINSKEFVKIYEWSRIADKYKEYILDVMNKG